MSGRWVREDELEGVGGSAANGIPEWLESIAKSPMLDDGGDEDVVDALTTPPPDNGAPVVTTFLNKPQV